MPQPLAANPTRPLHESRSNASWQTRGGGWKADDHRRKIRPRAGCKYCAANWRAIRRRHHRDAFPMRRWQRLLRMGKSLHEVGNIVGCGRF